MAVAARRPQHGRVVSVVVFDVNETLSDMAPMAGRSEDVGAPVESAPAFR